LLDGGQEIISARFLHPSEALREFREGKITLMPPQFYIITTVADILQGPRNTAEQRALVNRLSRGAFGQMVLNPRLCKPDGDDLMNGYSILTYEGDETRGGSKGRLHRAKLRIIDGVSQRMFHNLARYLMTFQIIKEIILQRNFDVFTEIEAPLFKQTSKL